MNYTPKQLQVLRLVHEYTAEHGYSPTYAELATQLGVTTITVFEHVAALERKGAIRRRRHEARSVEIVETNFLREQVTRKVLPVKARLSPDGRVIPEEKPAELLPAELVPWTAEAFLLSVEGNALAPAHILNGDLVLLEARLLPAPGETVLASVGEGPAALYTYRVEKNEGLLVAAGGSARSVPASRATIHGVYRGLVRTCRPKPAAP